MKEKTNILIYLILWIVWFFVTYLSLSTPYTLFSIVAGIITLGSFLAFLNAIYVYKQGNKNGT